MSVNTIPRVIRENYMGSEKKESAVNSLIVEIFLDASNIVVPPKGDLLDVLEQAGEDMWLRPAEAVMCDYKGKPAYCLEFVFDKQERGDLLTIENDLSQLERFKGTYGRRIFP